MKDDTYNIQTATHPKGFPTYYWTRYGACVTQFIAGTTGYRGGDAGHGCVTTIRIIDQGGTNMEAECTEGDVVLTLKGDDELTAIIEGLEFALTVLKEQRNRFKDHIAREFERRLEG